jgi:hypothetical protein
MYIAALPTGAGRPSLRKTRFEISTMKAFPVTNMARQPLSGHASKMIIHLDAYGKDTFPDHLYRQSGI